MLKRFSFRRFLNLNFIYVFFLFLSLSRIRFGLYFEDFLFEIFSKLSLVGTIVGLLPAFGLARKHGTIVADNLEFQNPGSAELRTIVFIQIIGQFKSTLLFRPLWGLNLISRLV